MRNIQLRDYFSLLLFVVYYCLPKIDLFVLPGFKQNLRLEDVVVVICFMFSAKSLKFNRKILGYLAVVFWASTFGAFFVKGVLISFVFWFRLMEYVIVSLVLLELFKRKSNRKIALILFLGFVAVSLVFHNANTRFHGFYTGPWEISSSALLLLPILSKGKTSTVITLLIILLGKARIQILAFCVAAVKIRYVLILGIVSLSIGLAVDFLDLRFESLLQLDYVHLIDDVISSTSRSDFRSLEDNYSDTSLLFRLLIWMDYLRPVIENPEFLVTGLGFGSGGVLTDGTYIRLLADFGLFGVLVFIKLIRFVYNRSNLDGKRMLFALLIIGITNDVLVSSRILVASLVFFGVNDFVNHSRNRPTIVS